MVIMVRGTCASKRVMKLLVRRTFSYWRALAVSSSKSGKHLPSRIVSRSVNTYVSVSATLVSNVDPRYDLSKSAPENIILNISLTTHWHDLHTH